MRGVQAIFNLEIKKKSGLSLNPDINHSKVFSSVRSDKFILHFIYPPWVRSEIETNDENNFINKVHFSSSKLCQFLFLGELEGNIRDKIVVEIKEEKKFRFWDKKMLACGKDSISYTNVQKKR